MKTIIRNGHIITAVDSYHADILIEDGKIQMIAQNLSVSADKDIDARGMLVLPGGIDVHTHFDMPFGGTTSSDDFLTGTQAAAFGGTTTIVDFAIQSRGHSMQEALETWLAKAEGKATIDYGFHMIISEASRERLAEMPRMVDQGVTSFKMFTAYPGVFMVDDGGIFRALQRAGEIGALIAIHAENGSVIDVLVEQALAEGHTAPKYHALTRPPEMEGEATHRVIVLAALAKVPLYIVHLSASQALDAVMAARDQGQSVYAETCPQYLFLSYDRYEEPGFDGAKYVMSPPLRTPEHQERLWRGLKTNDLQVVATDHCPFCMKDQKTLGRDNFAKIPNGAPGVETRMSLIYDGAVSQNRLSLNRFVEVTSTTPAKLFGMFPHKGTIAVGSDADLVLFDPDGSTEWGVKQAHMRVDYNPYEGRKTAGAIRMVLSRGEVIVDNGQFLGKQGRGDFIKRHRVQDL
ncbi:MAG: dihydropyrimidinase [Firmicutes bacterium]|jgi:dihydropyrimidinase|uniref:Dihydropyrimidinase n=1 Tax=Sulfobacillus benefaciens TaxID=453960 RepID=A0A2T2WUS0_9FIRM|nr:dihydropyrimidinase [Bacillota bacterium]MCL5013222.1 dihydropyrimidinase [Bacillota bacterium]PSR25984.1 MAG: dihydropyrimidinase [Sulfobacillus benefaciens]